MIYTNLYQRLPRFEILAYLFSRQDVPRRCWMLNCNGEKVYVYENMNITLKICGVNFLRDVMGLTDMVLQNIWNVGIFTAVMLPKFLENWFRSTPYNLSPGWQDWGSGRREMYMFYSRYTAQVFLIAKVWQLITEKCPGESNIYFKMM